MSRSGTGSSAGGGSSTGSTQVADRVSSCSRAETTADTDPVSVQVNVQAMRPSSSTTAVAGPSSRHGPTASTVASRPEAGAVVMIPAPSTCRRVASTVTVAEAPISGLVVSRSPVRSAPS